MSTKLLQTIPSALGAYHRTLILWNDKLLEIPISHRGLKTHTLTLMTVVPIR